MNFDYTKEKEEQSDLSFVKENGLREYLYTINFRFAQLF